jgi:sortase A
VIYGHSSSGDYYERTHDIAGAFSVLNKIKIGAIIKIDMNGRVYEFRVIKSKIVQPDDVSIIIGTPGKRTLTLFTCFPNGNNTSRFVVVANPVL